MKNHIMKKWVRALRSGKYKQGSGTLKQYNSKRQAQHCCLGVLCELYNKDMKKNKKKTLPETIHYQDSDFSFGYTRFGNKRDDLPKEVIKWSGMKNSLGEFVSVNNPAYDQHNLSDLNDTGRKFKTIANIIEKNWENL
jgi:hypothetical protein